MAAKEKVSDADKVLESGGVSVETLEANGNIPVAGFVRTKDIVQVEECEKIREDADPDKSLDSLKSSIKTHGILVPLLIEKHAEKEGKFNLIAGYRRLACALDLELDTVPVRVVDTDEQAKAVGEILGRARPSPELVRQVIGLVDNTAREGLSDLDIFRQLRFLIDADKGENFSRAGGTINIASLQKALGTGYMWMRNRVNVLTTFKYEEIEEIQKVIDKGITDKTGVPLSWKTVFLALRRGGVHVEAIKRHIWGGADEEEENEGDEPETKARKKAQRDLATIKRRVKSQALDDANIKIRLIGAPGSRKYEAEVTTVVTLKGSAFGGPRGDENITSLFDALTDQIEPYRKLKDAEVKEALRGAFDSAMTGLKGRLAAD